MGDKVPGDDAPDNIESAAAWLPQSAADREIARRLASDHERMALQTLVIDTVRSTHELASALDTLAARCPNIDSLEGRHGARRGFHGSKPSPLAKTEVILQALTFALIADDSGRDSLLEALYEPARAFVRKHATLAERTGLAFRARADFGAALVAVISEAQTERLVGVDAARRLADWSGWATCPFARLRSIYWGHRTLAPKSKPVPMTVAAWRATLSPEYDGPDIEQRELDQSVEDLWTGSITGWCEEHFDTATPAARLARSLLRTLGVDAKSAENTTR